jgi:hypothetical protein
LHWTAYWPSTKLMHPSTCYPSLSRVVAPSPGRSAACEAEEYPPQVLDGGITDTDGLEIDVHASTKRGSNCLTRCTCILMQPQ